MYPFELCFFEIYVRRDLIQEKKKKKISTTFQCKCLPFLDSPVTITYFCLIHLSCPDWNWTIQKHLRFIRNKFSNRSYKWGFQSLSPWKSFEFFQKRWWKFCSRKYFMCAQFKPISQLNFRHLLHLTKYITFVDILS